MAEPLLARSNVHCHRCFWHSFQNRIRSLKQWSVLLLISVSLTLLTVILVDGMKYLYDFHHSVFPIGDWFHTLGVYQFIDIDTTTLTPVYGPNNQTRLHWRWRVDWKVNTTGKSRIRNLNQAADRARGRQHRPLR